MFGIDALASCGVSATGQLHLTGGGARSVAFQQWVADIWGQPLAVHVDGESAAAGACRQAVVAATGAEAAWRLRPDLVVDPRAGVDGDLYRDAYGRTG
jgi:xylulokinase